FVPRSARRAKRDVRQGAGTEGTARRKRPARVSRRQPIPPDRYSGTADLLDFRIPLRRQALALAAVLGFERVARSGIRSFANRRKVPPPALRVLWHVNIPALRDGGARLS